VRVYVKKAADMFSGFFTKIWFAFLNLFLIKYGKMHVIYCHYHQLLEKKTLSNQQTAELSIFAKFQWNLLR